MNAKIQITLIPRHVHVMSGQPDGYEITKLVGAVTVEAMNASQPVQQKFTIGEVVNPKQAAEFCESYTVTIVKPSTR